VTPEEAWIIAMHVRFQRIMVVTRMHVPKWLMAVIMAALAIPGPQDELFVALIILGWAAFRPEMREDLKFAWYSIYHEAEWIRHAR
jgi:hypothetical protein